MTVSSLTASVSCPKQRDSTPGLLPSFFPMRGGSGSREFDGRCITSTRLPYTPTGPPSRSVNEQRHWWECSRWERLHGVCDINVCLGDLDWSSEVLRNLKHYLRAQRQGHHTIDCLGERGVESGSTQQSSLRGRERAIINQTNIGTHGPSRMHRYQLKVNCTELNSVSVWCVCHPTRTLAVKTVVWYGLLFAMLYL